MRMTRRDAVKLLAAVTSTTFLPRPALAMGSTPLPRMPLEEFVQDASLLASLRKGVRAMKKRKPSDPLSWFYQAAIHGVTPEAVKKAAADDPGVDAVFKKRYWNQCPHDGENSANFLPWHRGYTYYFERILRMHTEDDRFSLPYWNYTEKGNRKFPRELGIKHLDGNMNNDAEDNINPLYLAERDFYFTGYEHPFATGLPLLELSDSAVDISLSMDSPVFFGETEREGLGGGIADEDPSTRGLLESYPHDQIHRAVGGIIDSSTGEGSAGAMATPPTAGFDPIFSIHHCNIDRLWVEWACKPGKKWGQLPDDYWFDERPWYFFDTDGKPLNEPRRKYFDHRALGIRFKYENTKCTPLLLPPHGAIRSLEAQPVRPTKVPLKLMTEHAFQLSVLPGGVSVVPLGPALQPHLDSALSMMAAAPENVPRNRVFLRLQRVELGRVQATGFDLHLTTKPKATPKRSDPSFLGSIAMFRHPELQSHAVGHVDSNGMDETFDITKALNALGSSAADAALVAVPYSLLTTSGQISISPPRDFLKAGGFQLLVSQR